MIGSYCGRTTWLVSLEEEETQRGESWGTMEERLVPYSNKPKIKDSQKWGRGNTGLYLESRREWGAADLCFQSLDLGECTFLLSEATHFLVFWYGSSDLSLEWPKEVASWSRAVLWLMSECVSEMSRYHDALQLKKQPFPSKWLTHEICNSGQGNMQKDRTSNLAPWGDFQYTLSLGGANRSQNALRIVGSPTVNQTGHIVFKMTAGQNLCLYKLFWPCSSTEF